MPQEIRHIIFNDREICEMIFNWLAERGDKRAIAGARVDVGSEAEGVFIRMSYSAPDTPERCTLVIAGRDALAATILHCRSHCVPLPMKAEKHLEVVRGYLTLVLTSQSAVRAN